MAQKIKDEASGKEIEVFTAEEVKAQNDKALADYQAAHPDQTAALTEAATKLADLTKQLDDAKKAGGDDKDENIRNLRTALKLANDNIEAVKKETLGAIEAAKNQPTEEFRADSINLLSGKDADLKAKIEVHYKNLAGMPEGSKAEVKARLEAAYKLATDQKMPNILDGATGMGARGTGGMPLAGDEKVSENAKAIQSALGITDEDAKKFGPRPGQPGYQA